MGKKSKKYPQYSTGSVTVNGQTVATTKRDPNNNIVDSSYNMSETEKKIYNSIQSGLNTSLNNLFTITDGQKKLWDEQLGAMKKQGLEEIDSIYTPMETDLKNDVANRFGNIDNSIFLDNLDKITDKKAKAVSDLSDTLLTKQNNLYSEELQNRINTITLLNNLNSAMNNNILNFTNAANSSADSGNNYNNAAYNSTQQNGSPWWSSLATSAGNTMLSFLHK